MTQRKGVRLRPGPRLRVTARNKAGYEVGDEIHLRPTRALRAIKDGWAVLLPIHNQTETRANAGGNGGQGTA